MTTTSSTLGYENQATSNPSSATGNRVRKQLGRIWTGRVMSGLVVVFLLAASAFPKLFVPQVAVPSVHELGWHEKYLTLLAAIEISGAILYAIPRTAKLGAVLLTGLLGGAIASHLRIEAPLFSHTLFPMYVGLLMWGGLWLRDGRLR